jgi:hypothetical protein
MTGRQKGNDGPEKGRAPVSIAPSSLPQLPSIAPFLPSITSFFFPAYFSFFQNSPPSFPFQEKENAIDFHLKYKVRRVLSSYLPRGQDAGRAEKGHPFLVLEVAFFWVWSPVNNGCLDKKMYNALTMSLWWWIFF